LERAKGIGSKTQFPEGVGLYLWPIPTSILTTFPTTRPMGNERPGRVTPDASAATSVNGADVVRTARVVDETLMARYYAIPGTKPAP